MPLADLQKRASQIGVNGSKELQVPLKFLTRDAQETDFPDLSIQVMYILIFCKYSFYEQ